MIGPENVHPPISSRLKPPARWCPAVRSLRKVDAVQVLREAPVLVRENPWGAGNLE